MGAWTGWQSILFAMVFGGALLAFSGDNAWAVIPELDACLRT